MNSIISFLVTYNQFLISQIYQLLLFIAKNIPLKSSKYNITSPKYNKLTVDKLPIIKQPEKLDYNMDFTLTQVIGLSNDDPVSTEFRWLKQIIERLNRTFKFNPRA